MSAIRESFLGSGHERRDEPHTAPRGAVFAIHFRALIQC
jgi:hypothetical protein